MIQGRRPSTAAVAGHRPPTLLVPSFLRGFERPLVLVRIWNLTRGSPCCFCRERWPQVTPHTVPSARGAQTRGQRVRGRGLRPARAEPAQRWLSAGRRPSGSRRQRPPDPKSSRAPGRAARRPRAVSRDAGRWGSRVRSCVCPGPPQPRRRPRFPRARGPFPPPATAVTGARDTAASCRRPLCPGHCRPPLLGTTVRARCRAVPRDRSSSLETLVPQLRRVQTAGASVFLN